MIFSLAQDFHDAVAAMPQEHPKRRMLELLEEAIRRDIHFIARHPTTLFQCMWNICGEEWCQWLGIERWRDEKDRACTTLRWLQCATTPPIRLGTNQLALLRGHGGSVNCVAYSPDGSRVVSASDDQTLKIWNPETGEEVVTLKGHAGAVNACSYSPDGSRVVSASDDQTLKIWNPETGEEAVTLKGHAGAVNACSYSPDGSRVVSASDDMLLLTWAPHEKVEPVAFMAGHHSAVRSCAFAPSGWVVSAGGEDLSLKLWDLNMAQSWEKEVPLYASFFGHAQAATSCAFSPDGSRLASGGCDTRVRIWSVAAWTKRYRDMGEEVARPAHSCSITSCAFSHDGRHVASASQDGALFCWDSLSGKQLSCLQRPDTEGEWLFHLKCGQSVSHAGEVANCAYSPDGQRIVLGFMWSLCEWDTATGARRGRLPTDLRHRITALALSPDGKRLACGQLDGTVAVVNAPTGGMIATLCGHKGRVTSCSYSPDGKHLVSASSDTTLRIWDVESGKQVLVIGRNSVSVLACAFSPNGQHIVSGALDGSLRVWGVANGDEVTRLGGHQGPVRACAWSPDGAWLVSGGGDGVVRFWEARIGTRAAVFPMNGDVLCLQWGAAGQTVAAGDSSGLLAIIHLQGFKIADPHVTATRFWSPGPGEQPGHWEDDLAIKCPRCGKNFAPDAQTWSALSQACTSEVRLKSRVTPRQRPCGLHTDPLAVKCRLCGESLRLNSFVCDNWPVSSRKRPKLLRQGANITVKVTVNLNHGAGPARCVGRLAKACEEYGRPVYFARSDLPDIKVDAKSIMGIMSLEATKGTSLLVRVTGDDEAAQTMALGLYSALTGEDSYALDFDAYR